MAKKPPVVPIGKIVTTFGLRGQMKVELMTNMVERFDAGKFVLLKGESYKILASRLQKNQVVLELEGIRKIEQAEALKWEILSVPKGERPELDDDEYLVEDLIGMTVVTTDGQTVGQVDAVQEYPAHDVLVIGEILIPAIEQFVEMVDFDTETITVKLIDGMLGESSDELDV